MEKAFILFRRAYEQDDFEYGSFEPILVTLDSERVHNVFHNIIKSVINSGVQDYKVADAAFEYCNKNWCYEYKLEEYILDKLCPQFRKK